MATPRPVAAFVVSLAAGALSVFNAGVVLLFFLPPVSNGPGIPVDYFSRIQSAETAAVFGAALLVIGTLMFAVVRFHSIFAAMYLLVSVGDFLHSMASPAPLNVMDLLLPCLVLGLVAGILGLFWRPNASEQPPGAAVST